MCPHAEIEAEALAGLSRFERERAVNAALGELMREPIHAPAIRARAPGE